MHFFSFLAVLITTVSAIAFPGAEGFGRNAIGGRNGKVYVVSNLNDSGVGSLRDAVSKPDRIVVFSTGGLIKIKDRLVVSKRVSILGQTAPGDGITVYGNGWSFSNADDAIVRYVRIRMGKGGASGKDGITIAEGSNMIFDHVSVSWGRDETFSISGSEVGNITIQNSIIAQGLQTHSCGGLIQTDLGNGISLFRNLYIDNKTRNPKVKGTNDFSNNVVYNWGGGGGYIAGDSSAASEANIVGNYFISGPSTSVPAFTRGNANFKGYVEANFYDSDKNGTLNGAQIAVSSSNYGGMNIQTTKFQFPSPTNILSAAEALKLAETSAGASKVRDAVDKRLIAELQSYGTMGELIADENAAPMNGPGTITSGTAWVDSNENGIPDDVEGKFGSVEEWANSLVPSSY
ncbi:pectate lyase-like protein [Clathrospora elynae]|uniref:Pectate lyase-like protein n=1 Tax=Clathrospora elynae TaxID=706981 RepID=A0A6A5SID5_9PLEO|nr:pectate lyase-like protein [Clathrospora elynae]